MGNFLGNLDSKVLGNLGSNRTSMVLGNMAIGNPVGMALGNQQSTLLGSNLQGRDRNLDRMKKDSGSIAMNRGSSRERFHIVLCSTVGNIWQRMGICSSSLGKSLLMGSMGRVFVLRILDLPL